MSFVIDSNEWTMEGKSSGDISRALDSFLEFCFNSKKRDEIVLKGDELERREVHGRKTLWEFLFSPSAVEIPRDIVQELTATLGSLPNYVDLPAHGWPAGMPEEARINDEDSKPNLDIAWAHHNVRNGIPCACIGLTKTGIFCTTSSQGESPVHWVSNEESRIGFWRDAIILEGDSEKSLIDYAPHAYPSLYFARNVWRGIGEFEGGYARVRRDLKHSLEALNDFGSWIFLSGSTALIKCEDRGVATFEMPPNQLIEGRFRAVGLIASPENHAVDIDGGLRRYREVEISGRKLYCTWHIKLELYINRIHIHPPTTESHEKVVIGIFHSHLPLPGD